MAFCGSFNRGKIERFVLSELDETLVNGSVEEILQFHFNLVSYVMDSHFTKGSHSDLESKEFSVVMEQAHAAAKESIEKYAGLDIYSDPEMTSNMMSEVVAQYKMENANIPQERFEIDQMDLSEYESEEEDYYEVDIDTDPKEEVDEDIKPLEEIAKAYLTEGDTITDLVTKFKESISKYLVNDEVSGDMRTGVNTVGSIKDFLHRQSLLSAYQDLKSEAISTVRYMFIKNGHPVERELLIIPSYSWDGMQQDSFIKVRDRSEDGIYVYKSNNIEIPDSKGVFATIVVMDDPFSASDAELVEIIERKPMPDAIIHRTATAAVRMDEEMYTSDKSKRLNEIISVEFKSLLAQIYPQLYKGYKESFRTGFTENQVFHSDQESQRIKLLKSTTRRFTGFKINEDGRPVLTLDESNNYLFTQDFDLISDELRMRTDTGEVSDDILTSNSDGVVINSKYTLKKFLEEKLLHTNDPKYPIYLSIYYRFFYEGIYDIETGGRTTSHKSLSSILNTLSTHHYGEDDYRILRNSSTNLTELNKAFTTSNATLENLLHSFVVSIGSNAYTTRIPDRNGVANLAENKHASAVENLYANIEAAVFDVAENGAFVLTDREDVKKRIGRFVIKPKSVTLRVGTDIITFNVQRSESSSSGKQSQEGIPMVVTGIEGSSQPPSMDTLLRLFRSLGLPADISIPVLSDLEYYLREAKDERKYGKTGYQLSTFLVNLVYAIQTQHANGSKNIKETLYGYEKVLDAALERTHGSSKNKSVLTSVGEIAPTQTVSSKFANLKLEILYVKRDRKNGGRNMSSGSFISTGQLELLRSATKDGFVKGDISKAAENLTVGENVQQAIETYFIGRLAHTSRKQFIVQPMNLADKKNIPAVLLRSGDNNGYEAFPIKRKGKVRKTGPDSLDTDFLKAQWYKSHSEYFKRYEKSLIESWKPALAMLGIDSTGITDATGLAKLISRSKIPFSSIITLTDLTKNAFVIEDSNGFAVVPASNVNKVNMFKQQHRAFAYVDLQLGIFKRELANIGYTSKSVGIEARKGLSKLLGTVYTSNEDAMFNAMTTAYFFAQSTAGLEIARILNGGEVQYKQYKKGKDDIIIEDIDFKHPEVILSEVTEALNSRDYYPPGSMYELYNEMMESNMSESEMVTAIIMNQILTMETAGFVDQLKRNSMLSTTGMSACLASDNEPGAMLTSHTNMITVEEFTMLLDVVGHPEQESADPYDGVMLLHPAYSIMYNNSFGNNESAYSTKNGSAIKDLTLTTDEHGIIHSEKKASFDAWNYEILKNATPSHMKWVMLMGQAIQYGDNGREIYVDRVDSDGNLLSNAPFDTVIDRDIWKNNGLGLGLISVDNGSGRRTITSVAEIRGMLASGEMTLSQLEHNLDNEVYKTNKVPVIFNNFQEIWDYFGFIDNQESLVNATNVIGYTSVGDDLTLQNVIYDIRDKLIHKVGHESQVKIGSRKLITKEEFEDPIGTGLSLEGRYVVSLNNNNITILNAQHSPEITSERSVVNASSEENMHESRVTLVRQMIAANKAQGRSMKESSNIDIGLSVLSSTKLELLKNVVFKRVRDVVVDNNANLDEAKLRAIYNEIGIKEFNSEKERKQWEKDNAVYIATIDAGIERFVRDLLKQQMDVMGSGGLSADILSPEFINNLSFNLNQIMPYAQSKIYSEYNKAGIQLKFGGGQYVVSASHHHLSTYNVNTGTGQIKHMTRSDLNKAAYGTIGTSLSVEDESRRVALGLVDEVITTESIQLLTPSDYVMLPVPLDIPGEGEILANTPITLSSITRKLAKVGMTVEDAMGMGMTSRLLGVYRNTQVQEKLRWLAFSYRDPKTGEIVDFLDSKEYGTYRIISQILSGKSKISPKNQESLDALRKAYFLHSTKLRSGIDTSLFRTSEAENQMYEEFMATNELADVTNSMIAWVHGNKSLKSVAEKVVEFSLSNIDGTRNWYARPAEFYSPILSKLTYYLNSDDTIRDIEGMNEDPDIEAVVTDGTLTYEEQTLVEHFYNKRGNFTSGKEILLKKKEGYQTESISETDPIKKASIESKIQNIDRYISQRDIRTSHIVKWFNKRILSNIDSSRDFDFSSIIDRGFSKSIDIQVLKTYDNAIRKLSFLQKNSGKDDVLYSHLAKVKAEVMFLRDKAEEAVGENTFYTTKEQHKYLLTNLLSRHGEDSFVKKFASAKSSVLAESFDMSLRFITGRIPGQGKQSSVSGKIKAFINGQQNSSFSALEMLIITGADYDIDKQNLMAYLMSDSGENVFWGDYTDDGSLDSPISKDMYEKRLEAKLEGKPKDQVEAIRAYELERFYLAVHNNVIYNLIKTIESSYNAIEAATKIDGERLGNFIETPSYEGLKDRINKSKNKVLEVLHTSNKPTTMNPIYMFKSERDALDGKDGTSITASQLRSFFTVFQSFITSADESMGDYYLFHSQYSQAEVTEMQSALKELFPDRTFKFDKNAIQVADYDDNGVFSGVKNLRTISNASMYIPTPEMKSMNFSERVAEYRKEMLDNAGNDEAQYAIAMRYVTEENALGDIMVEPQVWEDLSAILSAATDNAKLMILGRIGITGDTNIVVATMLHTGLQLKDAIRIIRGVEAMEKADSSVKIFKALQDSKDTSKPDVKNPVYSLRKAIDLYIASHKKDIEGINALTNPIMQLSAFVDISEEFTAIATLTAIQTGMPVPMKDAFSYVYSIENQINNKIQAYNVENPADAIEKFDLQRFVRAAMKMHESKGSYTDDYVTRMVDGYNRVKAGVNIPFVLKNTPHLFNYYITMFEAKRITDRVADIYSITEAIILSTQEEDDKGKLYNVDQIYDDVKNSVVKYTVAKYLSSLEGDERIYRVPGSDNVLFDVSEVEDTNIYDNIAGRKEFVQMMASTGINYLKAKFPNNRMVAKFTAPQRTDSKSQEVMPVIRGVVLNDLSQDEFIMFRDDMDRIKNEDYEAYKALFMYSLIVHNAKFGGGSVAALAHTDVIEGYSLYLKNNIKDIAEEINRNKKDFYILVPELLPKKYTYSKPRITQEMADSMEDIPLPSGGAIDQNNAISYLNSLRLNPKEAGGKKMPDYFMSQDSNDIFAWDQTLQSYVVLTFENHYAVNTINPKGTTLEERVGAIRGVVLGKNTSNEIVILKKADSAFKELLEKGSRRSVIGINPNNIRDNESQYIARRSRTGEYVLLNKNILEREIDKSDSIIRLIGNTIKKKAIEGKRASQANDFITLTSLGDKLYITNLETRLDQKDLDIRNKKLRSGVSGTIMIPQDKRMDGDYTMFELTDTNKPVFEEVISKAKETAKPISREDVMEAAEALHTILESVKIASKYGSGMSMALAMDSKKLHDTMRSFNSSTEAVLFMNERSISLDAIKGTIGTPIEILKGFKEVKKLMDMGLMSESKPVKFITNEMIEEFSSSAEKGSMSFTDLMKMLNALESDSFSKFVAEKMSREGMDLYTDVDGNAMISEGVRDSFVQSIRGQKPKESRVTVGIGFANSNKRVVNSQVMGAIMDKVSEALPENYATVLMSTKEIEADKSLGVPDASKTKGFVKGNLIVYNSDLVDMDTPLHEFAHIYFNHLKFEDNTLYKDLIKKALETELYEEMKALYPEATDVELGEEILAELVSRFQTQKGSKTIENIKKSLSDSSVFDKVIDYLAKLFNLVFGKEVIKSNMSFTSIIDKIGVDVLSEYGGIFDTFSERTLSMIAMSNMGAEIDIKAAKKLLEDYGYIYTICE
jgi:hypothetical protein